MRGSRRCARGSWLAGWGGPYGRLPPTWCPPPHDLPPPQIQEVDPTGWEQALCVIAADCTLDFEGEPGIGASPPPTPRRGGLASISPEPRAFEP